MDRLRVYTIGSKAVLLFTCLIVGLFNLGWSVHAYAVQPVEAVALFKDRAVVRTHQGQTMLKVGETSEHGVTLVEADPHSAIVRYQGEAYKLDLSTRVAGSFAKPTQQTVSINRDGYGQYRMRGSINGHVLNFLVDTGASLVAMSETQAIRMGLSYLDGARGTVQTAQGTTGAYFVYLEEVTLGGIKQQRVRATVIEGGYPTDVLLGMSFLNSLRMNDDEGVLTLTAKF